MSSEKIKANIKLNGEVVPFILNREDEPFYREAAIKINDKLAELHNKYGARASSEVLMSAVAVEAMVDAIQAHQNYQKLRSAIDQKLDHINGRFEE
ncbi:cell division protein ZapA [Marinilongibacter aquaticus]|uniref:cell division protein ZapA n=1 Tax=Marinilongibacter aquaticus TaxID=2975157 RepID=UPI0021BD3A0B|nr:cell division protein ZapA [Marinilongibacter aquaticus]UBM58936.1 cell division protein ZapA [Marinilongibacter aquaticus]